MPTFVHTADGSKTVFNFSTSALAKTVRVNGAVVTPATLTNSAATITPAPLIGSIVEVIYGPLNGANPATIPTAIEQTYAPVITPVVRYWGAGADSLAFTLDTNARKVDVYAAGLTTSN